MNELQIFSNDRFGQVRTLEDGDKILFCGSDVAKALGYSNIPDALKRHCRYIVKHDAPHPQNHNKQIEMAFIPEGDIYRLAARSKLPGAEEFESWIFDDVLPTIRKHGIYAVDDLLNNPDFAIKAFTALKEEREKNKILKTEINQQKQIIGELQPKASYVDKILNNNALVTITQIAKDYGMSGTAMNKLLFKLGVQYKQSGQWLLYFKYHNTGYTHSKTYDFTRSNGSVETAMETRWTQKGRLFIYELLKKDNIYPVIERNEQA